MVGDTRGGNWGCHPYFFLKNLATFLVSSSAVSPLISSSQKLTPFLLIAYRFFIAFTRVSPPRGCHPTPFYLSNLVSPLFFVNLPTIFFTFRVSPPGGCHSGRSAPAPSPYGDATERYVVYYDDLRSRHLLRRVNVVTHYCDTLLRYIKCRSGHVDDVTGTNNDPIYRLSGPHIFVLLRLSGRERLAGRLRSDGLQQLRGRSVVGRGKPSSHLSVVDTLSCTVTNQNVTGKYPDDRQAAEAFNLINRTNSAPFH